MPALKKCYYEVLGVERNAPDEDIKKSFRKLALQLHPDKNPDRAEEAKAEFQILQQAYEVLSNPQERAWYDEHRQAVLREGLDADYDDFNIDLMAYCTSSCYKGFGDDDEGFYKVYRDLFAKLTAEELEAGWDDEHDEDIPNFGDSESSYDDVVGPFYAFWESFCTMKSFAWIDEYDTRRADCRRIARLMGKENKKVRSEAKKAWNREVRALVDFIKRKDKRVIAWKTAQEVILKEKQEELARKSKEAKAKRLAERKKLLESTKASKVQHEDKHKPLLQEMEQWMSNEFGEQLSDKESDEETPTCFYCEACNKSFRSEKAFINHEKSKKHLAQVQQLREMMKQEDEMFQNSNSDEEEIPNETEEQTDEIDVNNDATDSLEATACQLNNLEIDNEETESKSSHESDALKSDESDDCLEKQFLARAANRGKKGKKGGPRIRTISIDDEATNGTSETESVPVKLTISSSDESKPVVKTEPKKKRKSKKQTGKSAVSVENSVPNQSSENKEKPPPPSKINSIVDLQCVACKMTFSSRSQLFRHIKSTGHAAPLDTVKEIAATPTITKGFGIKDKKKKGKRKEEDF